MNLDQFIEKLHKAKKDVKLPGSVKSDTKGKLLNFIELRPIAPRINKISVSMFPFFKSVPIMAGVLVIMVASVGISFAAENSLPGEVLYPVKVNVNEEIVGALNITVVGKATWEVKRAERRLKEADRLALVSDTNPLAEDKIAKLEEKFEEHAVKVAARIDKMESDGHIRKAAQVANKFEASLKAHEEILERIQDKKFGQAAAPAIAALEAKQTSVRPLESKLRENLASIEFRRVSLEAKIAVGDDGEEKDGLEDSAEVRLTSAKLRIEGVRNFLDENKDKISIESYLEIEARLTFAKEVLEKGRKHADEDLFGEAYNLGSEAIKIADGAMFLLNAKLELGLNGDTEPVFVPLPIAPFSTSTDPLEG